MGAITDVVKRTVPASYRAMVGPSDISSSYYSKAQLQSLVDYVQFKLLATVAGATLEATVYDLVLLEFLGKVTTIKFIPAAIDFWMDQYEQQTTTGTNEHVQFAARLAHLREIQQELSSTIDAEWGQLAPIYGFVIRGQRGMKPDVSYGDNGRGLLLTPDPQEWPAQDSTDSSTASPWEW